MVTITALKTNGRGGEAVSLTVPTMADALAGRYTFGAVHGPGSYALVSIVNNDAREV